MTKKRKTKLPKYVMSRAIHSPKNNIIIKLHTYHLWCYIQLVSESEEADNLHELKQTTARKFLTKKDSVLVEHLGKSIEK